MQNVTSANLKVTKINESYSLIEGNEQSIRRIHGFLRVERPNAYFDKMVKLGLKDKYVYFSKLLAPNKILIYNGHLFLLSNFGITCTNELSNIKRTEIDKFLKSIKVPFTPYDYQLRNVILALQHNKVLFKSCTSSGKSLSITMILEFFRQKGYRGILVVPNVNLLTQFQSDIKSYGFEELYNQTQLLGNGAKSDFKTCLTITTWQSMVKEVDNINDYNFDFIICDEAHRMASDCTSDIIIKSIKTKIKLGFTGTLPDDPISKMTLIGLFGNPITIITASELIDRGLATPVIIKSLLLNYDYQTKKHFNDLDNYQSQLKFIKEYSKRTAVISKIACSTKNNDKNTLILFQHTEHGKEIFRKIIKDLYDIDISEKQIVGKNSIEFQKQYKVLFMNGEQSGDLREDQRQFMEHNNGVIMVGNYACMSTGINIRNLHILIFASPLKAFTTISQSLGRLMRKHDGKKESVVVDLVDNFGFRKPGGIFYKQYKHRLSQSYLPEEFRIEEHNISI